MSNGICDCGHPLNAHGRTGCYVTYYGNLAMPFCPCHNPQDGDPGKALVEAKKYCYIHPGWIEKHGSLVPAANYSWNFSWRK